MSPTNSTICGKMPDNVNFSGDDDGLYHGSHDDFQVVGAIQKDGDYYKIQLNAETKINSRNCYVIKSKDIPILLEYEGRAKIFKLEVEDGTEYKEKVGVALHSKSKQAINYRIKGYVLLTTPKVYFKMLTEGKKDIVKISTAPEASKLF